MPGPEDAAGHYGGAEAAWQRWRPTVLARLRSKRRAWMLRPMSVVATVQIVLVDGQAVTNGGKISVPAIRRRLETLGLRPDDH